MFYKRAIIVGAGLRWREDLDAAKRIQCFETADIVAVNGVGILIQEHITMWCSIHGDYLPSWIRQRAAQGLNVPRGHIYGNFMHDVLIPDGIVNWARPNGGGSSGLFATLIAIDQGYNKIILAGMPLEGRERVAYQDNEQGTIVSEPSDQGYNVYQAAWRHPLIRPVIRQTVRSISGGFTQNLLGRPDSRWSLGEDYTTMSY